MRVWSRALAPATRRTSSPSSPLTIALCDPSDAAQGTPERNASATRSGNDSAPSRCSSGIAAVVTTHTASQATSARHGPWRATKRALGTPSSSSGADSAASTTLIRVAEPVVSSTNHGSATAVISEPSDDTTWAPTSARTAGVTGSRGAPRSAGRPPRRPDRSRGSRRRRAVTTSAACRSRSASPTSSARPSSVSSYTRRRRPPTRRSSTGRDQALVAQPLERPVERAGRQPDAAVRELTGELRDRVAVARAVQEARQQEVGRLSHPHTSGHDTSVTDLWHAGDAAAGDRTTARGSSPRRATE